MTDNNNKLPTEKNVEDYSLLKDMLDAQRKEFDILSNKKPNEHLNKMKIKMVNRVLELLNEDDIPTNSDVVLIISQYETAIDEFRSRYYQKDEHQSNYIKNVHRWMTEEYPPDYYEGQEIEEDEENDENKEQG